MKKMMKEEWIDVLDYIERSAESTMNAKARI